MVDRRYCPKRGPTIHLTGLESNDTIPMNAGGKGRGRRVVSEGVAGAERSGKKSGASYVPGWRGRKKTGPRSKNESKELPRFDPMGSDLKLIQLSPSRLIVRGRSQGPGPGAGSSPNWFRKGGRISATRIKELAR